MNWGKGIAIVYIVFVLLILGLVYLTSQQKFDLVSSDYYQQELDYQEKLDANARVSELNDKIKITLEPDRLLIILPAELHKGNIKGRLECYYKADSKHDLTVEFNPDEQGMQAIERSNFEAGNYILKLSFNDGAKNYYLEKEMRF